MIRIFSFVFMSLMTSLPVNAAKLLIIGDSLSAGYQMPLEKAWPTLLAGVMEQKGKSVTVVNGSISGDTTGNGIARLPALLSEHTPDIVLIELGANDGLRGFPPNHIQSNLTQLIQLVKQADAEPLLMQIHVLPNYGKRYTQAFSAIYPQLSHQLNVPLIPFFLEGVITRTGWMMDDGLHPKAVAQPWIADFVANELINYL
ncbi:multifunctional acyl-CoA thioesterase I/protease I/lysophospholipase L1 [Vibrio ostreicida]|uniref:multifunctional acyl-CoA thioesterase I/protease I/lysophospholipase L1 n=1 Tax=Vibrio ostreicida TaxID=526588 RepID=UPI0009708BFB|nr:multifunctional acyl-CoA thioesterase I/protease I/lysophospholipase L1 [Vibrio ostreicida]